VSTKGILQDLRDEHDFHREYVDLSGSEALSNSIETNYNLRLLEI
jgi:hypothetical protein